MGRADSERRAYLDLPWGGQIHYRFKTGRPAGATRLVLLHQVSSNSRMFTGLMATLAERYEVIAPDLPGFGQSDRLPAPPSIEGYADAIAVLLQSLMPTETILAGHHTGALVATELAKRDPTSVSRLILMGFPYYVTAAEREARLAAISPRPIVPRPGARHLLAEWSRLRALDRLASLAVVHEEFVDTLLAPRYDLAYGAALAYDGAAALSNMRVPIAGISGDRDHLHPLQLRMAADLGVTLEVVPGGGVFMCRHMPDETAAALARLLEDGVAEPS